MSRVWTHASQRQDTDLDDRDAGDSGGSDWDDEFGPADGDDLDPVEFARRAREMAAMSGEPLDAEFDTALRHIESGADPEDVFGEVDNAFDTATDPES